MVLRMKNFNILGFTERCDFYGGSRKSNVEVWLPKKGGLESFSIYKGVAWQERRRWCFWRGIDTPMRTVRVVQYLKKTLYFVSKMTRIWWLLIWALKSLKNLHFDWSLLCKVYNVWPKKVQRSIFHDTEESCKIWRKTDLWFGNWHEEFSKFSSEHLKMSKLVFSWDPFVQNRKCMSYKLHELQRSYK